VLNLSVNCNKIDRLFCSQMGCSAVVDGWFNLSRKQIVISGIIPGLGTSDMNIGKSCEWGEVLDNQWIELLLLAAFAMVRWILIIGSL